MDKQPCKECDGTGVSTKNSNDSYCYSCGGTGMSRKVDKSAPDSQCADDVRMGKLPPCKRQDDQVKVNYLLTDEQMDKVRIDLPDGAKCSDCRHALIKSECDFCEPLIRADAQKEAREVVKEMVEALEFVINAEDSIPDYVAAGISRALSKGKAFMERKTVRQIKLGG